MNKYALNINTLDLKKKIIYLKDFKNNYNFLNYINISNKDVYYDILNNIEDFKLKNIYNYIYKRIIFLEKNINIPKLNIQENITPLLLNKYLNDYINNNIVRSIIIMNSIQQYYYPIY
tara:strand:+ start:228 stop:581 length:354 start_codon:yes stop_codon:yes gene_type:complete